MSCQNCTCPICRGVQKIAGDVALAMGVPAPRVVILPDARHARRTQLRATPNDDPWIDLGGEGGKS